MDGGIWGGAQSDSGLVWGQSQKDILRQEWAVPGFPAAWVPREGCWEGFSSTVSC